MRFLLQEARYERRYRIFLFLLFGNLFDPKISFLYFGNDLLNLLLIFEVNLFVCIL